MVIKELEIQKIYIKKYKSFLNNTLFAKIRKFAIENGLFNEIPSLINDKLYLKINNEFLNFIYGKNQLSNISLLTYEKLYNNYSKENLKIKEKFNIRMEAILPIWIHINENKYKYSIKIIVEKNDEFPSFNIFCGGNLKRPKRIIDYTKYTFSYSWKYTTLVVGTNVI